MNELTNAAYFFPSDSEWREERAIRMEDYVLEICVSK